MCRSCLICFCSNCASSDWKIYGYHTSNQTGLNSVYIVNIITIVKAFDHQNIHPLDAFLLSQTIQVESVEAKRPHLSIARTCQRKHYYHHQQQTQNQQDAASSYLLLLQANQCVCFADKVVHARW